MNRLVRLVLCLAVFLPALARAGGALEVVDPWVREAPPTVQTLAAYMALVNPGKQELAVVGVESPMFGKVEMHETVHKDGMATMQARERLVVAAGKRLELAPGGLHLMLIAPRQGLKSGERVPLTLKLSDGGQVTLEAVVRSGAGAADASHQHDQHGQHGQH